MTTRTIYYANQLNNSQFFLNDEKQKMLDNSMLAQAILGSGTLIFGLPCLPTDPTSLSVTIGTGGIFKNVNVDSTQFGTAPTFIAADTTNQVTKMAYQIGVQTPIVFVPPTTPGFSRNDLIQFSFSEADGNNQNLPFWNGVNTETGFPNSPVFQSLNENRIDSVVTVVKQGVAATTGTQTTPSPDAGLVGGWVVTTAQGQTSITSGNITQYASAPFFATLTNYAQFAAQNQWSVIQNFKASTAEVATPGSQILTASATPVKLTLEASADFDTDNIYNGASRRFQPSRAGYYRISAIVNTIIADSTGSIVLRLFKNGTFLVDLDGTTYISPEISDRDFSGSVIVLANGTTDYFELFFLNNSVGDVQIDPSVFQINFIGTA